MIIKYQQEWFYDDVRLEIPFYNYTVVTETLRLFYDRSACPPHWHSNYELHIITSGVVSYSIGESRNIQVGPGSILLLPPDTIHSETIVTPAKGIAFGFQFKNQKPYSYLLPELQAEITSVLDAFRSMDKHYMAYSPGCGRLLSLFSQLYDNLKSRQAGCLLLAQSLLTEILVELFRIIKETQETSELPKKRIADDMAFIVSDYFSGTYEKDLATLSIEELAGLTCMSKRQISRYLLKTFNKTFVELLNEAKINDAKYLLVNTKIGINDIAARLGWSNKYFYHRFKTALGTTPHKYRRTTAPPDDA